MSTFVFFVTKLVIKKKRRKEDKKLKYSKLNRKSLIIL